MPNDTVTEAEGLTRIAAFLADDVVKALKIRAIEEDTTVTAILDRLVRAELQRADRKKATR